MYREYFEKLNKLDEEFLAEMAVVNPKMCRNKTIQVEVEQRDEGNIPHIHVYHNHNRNPKECSSIRLDIPEYSTHHSIIKMPDNVKREFIEIMKADWGNRYMKDNAGNLHPASGYQAAVIIWAETFEDGDLSKFQLDEKGLIKQLDYSDI